MWFRSLLFALLFPLLTTICVFVALLVLPFGRGAYARYVRMWAGTHGKLARVVLGVRPQIEGRLPSGPVLVAAKHESAWETFLLLHLLGDPMIVLKREIASIPIFGWLVRRHGAIPIDRTASVAAMRQMLQAADVARETGRTVLIFPEGTRVEHGEAAPIQAGFAGLYARLGLPVVPVSTDAGRVWPRGLRKHSGVARLRFGEPIPAGRPRKAIEAEVHAAINALND